MTDDNIRTLPVIPLTFSVEVNGGNSARVNLEPIIDVKPLRLVMQGQAYAFRVTSIYVGRRSLLMGTGGVQGDAFLDTKPAVTLEWPTLIRAGMQISIEVRNAERAAATFEGYILCQDVSSHPCSVSPRDVRRAFDQIQSSPTPNVPHVLPRDEHGYLKVAPDLNHPAVMAFIASAQNAVTALEARDAAWPDTAHRAARELRLAIDTFGSRR